MRNLFILLIFCTFTYAVIQWGPRLFKHLKYHLDSSKTPIADNSPAIRIAVLNDFPKEHPLSGGLEKNTISFLAQAHVFSKEKTILLFSVHTDAFPSLKSKKPFRELSVEQADQFHSYTRKKSLNYIHITSSKLVRLINLMGGVSVFLEEPLFFRKSPFQYPQGPQHFFGEQLVENLQKDRDQAYHNESPGSKIERLTRQGNIILSLFWAANRLTANLDTAELRQKASQLFMSNLEKDQLTSLFKFLKQTESFMKVVEVPLAFHQEKRQRELQRSYLSVKAGRAALLFDFEVRQLQLRHADKKKKKRHYAVAVLNGTTAKGLARQTKFALQDLGPKIIHVSNYEPKPLEKSILLVRRGDTHSAQDFMELLNFKREQVYFSLQATDIDISLAIGLDFNLRNIK